MKIAVISDTHMGRPPAWLDGVYARWLEPADHLVHCGDITSPETWSYFMQHKSFLCVRGNCDWDQRLVDELEPMLTAKVGGLTLGRDPRLGVPGPRCRSRWPRPSGRITTWSCYGHTHRRDWSVVEGVQLCNPRLPGRVRLPGRGHRGPTTAPWRANSSTPSDSGIIHGSEPDEGLGNPSRLLKSFQPQVACIRVNGPRVCQYASLTLLRPAIEMPRRLAVSWSVGEPCFGRSADYSGRSLFLRHSNQPST